MTTRRRRALGVALCLGLAAAAPGACADGEDAGPGTIVVLPHLRSREDAVPVVELTARATEGLLGEQLARVALTATGIDDRFVGRAVFECDPGAGQVFVIARVSGFFPTAVGVGEELVARNPLDPTAVEAVADCVAGAVVEVSIDLGDDVRMAPPPVGRLMLDLDAEVGRDGPATLWDASGRFPSGDFDWNVRIVAEFRGRQPVFCERRGAAQTVEVRLVGLYAAPPTRPGAWGSDAPEGALAWWPPPAVVVPATCDLALGRVELAVVPAWRADDDAVGAVRLGSRRCRAGWTCGEAAGEGALEIACEDDEPEAPALLMDAVVLACDDGGDDVVIDPLAAGEVAADVTVSGEAGVIGSRRWVVPVVVPAERLGSRCRVSTRATVAPASVEPGGVAAGDIDEAVYPYLAVDVAAGAACADAHVEEGGAIDVRYLEPDPEATGSRRFGYTSR